MIFNKKTTDTNSRRGGKIEYKKQQSYHYSAKRSANDRIFGRKETNELENEVSSNSRGLTSKFSSLSAVATGFLLIGFLLFMLYLSSSVAIQTANDSGFIGDKAAVQNTADTYMRSSLLNRLKVTFNPSALEEKLRQSFPEFSDIEVSTPFFGQKPIVTVSFAKPTLLLTTGNANYVVSETGVILADITKTKPEIDTTKLTLVQDETGVPLQVGKVALTSEQVQYIQEITYQTDQKNLATQSLILVPGGGELHVRYGGIPYFVKYNFYEDARKSSGTFLATKDDLASKGITPAEYIDVRIAERAYVK